MNAARAGPTAGTTPVDQLTGQIAVELISTATNAARACGMVA